MYLESERKGKCANTTYVLLPAAGVEGKSFTRRLCSGCLAGCGTATGDGSTFYILGRGDTDLDHGKRF